MASKRATLKSDPKRSPERHTKTDDSSVDGRGPTGSAMWSAQEHPQVYESWRQRGGGNLACKQRNEEAFCMGTPVILWIERQNRRRRVRKDRGGAQCSSDERDLAKE